MTKTLRLNTCGPIAASIRPPGSKSITNRALVCAALASGSSELRGVLDSEDTRLMVEALRQLGVQADVEWNGQFARIVGCAGPFPVAEADLFVGNSGTTMRFLTAVLSQCRGRFRLSGTPRMHQRPIGDLIDALRQLGIDAQTESPNNCPPVVIRSSSWNRDHVDVAAGISSQFVSGLMLAAPLSDQPITLTLRGPVVSRPYIGLTAHVMSAFGAQAEIEADVIKVSNQKRYRGCAFEIEPDATAASYFLGAAAIAGGSVTIEGLGKWSAQGDLRFVQCLERMGCSVEWRDRQIALRGPALRGIDVDMNEFSDTVQTLAVVALFVDGPTTIRNVAHIRHKESDRIADLARELRKLGGRISETVDGLQITPDKLRGAELDTYDDHRMAMSWALAGLRIPGVVIHDPECVGKTYPNFFRDLARVTQAGVESI